jgi:O-antigen ligase
VEHPIVGGGMESLNEYYHSQDNFINDRPHNIFLQISSFIGIPGAIVYLILILVLAFNNLKNIKDNTMNIMIYFTAMTYFISSVFGNSMYYTSPYFMILLGLLIGIYKDNIKIKEKN